MQTAEDHIDTLSSLKGLRAASAHGSQIVQPHMSIAGFGPKAEDIAEHPIIQARASGVRTISIGKKAAVIRVRHKICCNNMLQCELDFFHICSASSSIKRMIPISA